VKVNHPYSGFVLKTFLIYPTCLNACLRLKGMQRQLDVATKISSRINRQAVFQYAHRFQMQYSKILNSDRNLLYPIQLYRQCFIILPLTFYQSVPDYKNA